VLPSTPAVRDGLRRLATSADLAEHTDASTLEALAAHDVVLDADDLAPLLGHPGLAASAVAALARQAGPGLGRSHAARRRSRTRTHTFGHPASTDLAEAFTRLTGSAGLREAGPRQVADCDVLLGVGEPERERLDAWTRAGTPYLLVRMVEGRAVVGPFVEPGATACLRCLDAHCTDADPAWPLLLRQYAAASSHDRSDGVPEPVDPLLAALAVAWAARDLATYVDGGRPSTWSTTVTLHPVLDRIETRTWWRHPACGCSWS
jgi:bacteriocin biosynthesis cyclodehydratase domain-containing protein